MGYSTSYKGSLKITPDLTPAQIDHLRSFLGEDCRDHKNWKSNKWYKKLYYTIDLDLVLKTNLGKTLEENINSPDNLKPGHIFRISSIRKLTWAIIS